MGNTVTGLQEKVGKSMLQSVKKAGWSEKAQRRLTYFGTELVETRATYNDYLAGVSQFKQQWKEGLMGRDIAGLAICAWLAFTGFNVGQMLGRGTWGPIHGMVSVHLSLILSVPSSEYPGVKLD